MKHGILPILLVAFLTAGVLFTAMAAPGATIPVPGDPAGSWTTPKPPYPAAARIKHEQGIIHLKITTDASGAVIKAVASVPANETGDLSDLGAMCVKWALAQWHGLPNVTRTVKINFVQR